MCLKKCWKVLGNILSMLSVLTSYDRPYLSTYYYENACQMVSLQTIWRAHKYVSLLSRNLCLRRHATFALWRSPWPPWKVDHAHSRPARRKWNCCWNAIKIVAAAKASSVGASAGTRNSDTQCYQHDGNGQWRFISLSLFVF